MNGLEFLEAVRNLQLKNGSIYEVINPKGKKLFEVTVVRTQVHFMDNVEVRRVPEDMYTEKYTFNLVEE